MITKKQWEQAKIHVQGLLDFVATFDDIYAGRLALCMILTEVINETSEDISNVQ